MRRPGNEDKHTLPSLLPPRTDAPPIFNFPNSTGLAPINTPTIGAKRPLTNENEKFFLRNDQQLPAMQSPKVRKPNEIDENGTIPSSEVHHTREQSISLRSPQPIKPIQDSPKREPEPFTTFKKEPGSEDQPMAFVFDLII